MIRNESDILIPGSSDIRRPDRVMVSEDKAVIVDYKFGEKRASSHRKQIEAYAALLRDMGYADVQGYLWYVSSGVKERIV
jgi:CRISPR/Cas system-associated exonuclease Cas4 (RecB family)